VRKTAAVARAVKNEFANRWAGADLGSAGRTNASAPTRPFLGISDWSVSDNIN
jgi:hypothetical protein